MKNEAALSEPLENNILFIDSAKSKVRMVCIVATICLEGKKAGMRLGCEIGTQICIRRILPEKTQVVLGKELRNLGVGGRGRRRRPCVRIFFWIFCTLCHVHVLTFYILSPSSSMAQAGLT